MTNRSKMQKAMLLLGVFVVFATFATDLMAQCNENAPQVGGAIYGGGRKANVNGKSVIHVNETKPRTQVSNEGCGKYTPAIGGVYGGNDIAGCVLGADGSTITIGNASSNKCVSIGEVYGGGNGYYSYPSSTYTNGQEQGFGDLEYDDAKTGEGAVKLWNKGSVNSDDVLVETLSESLMIPRIKKTSVTIQGTNTYVDSVFGGSKNAYTEKDAAYQSSDVIATINVNNGVVGAVFGGNNYGGTIGGAPFAGLTQASLNATMAKINININGSLLAPNESDLLCYGTSYGVGTVFGGGNKVTAPNVVLTIRGGQVDTLFAGGNSASVLSSSITVNNSTYTGGCSNINDGNYDVRCLFAGNNAAPMESLPTVTLTRGHVHTLYGGGNAGDMKAEVAKTVDGVNIKASTNVLIHAADDSYLVIDEVYGGCQKANVDHSTYVEMNHGTVGTIYGGCNISGTVGFAHSNSADNAAGGSTYVVLNGGTICHDVFGGSNGAYACVDADGKYGETPFDPNSDYRGLALPKVNSTHVFAQGAAVSGNIYGGGNMAPVGDAANYGGNANVELKSGSINNAFAGGRMANVYGFATIFTPPSVAADALTVQNIFGGNDISGNVSNVETNRRNINSIAGATAVDGYQVELQGDNAASYVKIEGAPTIEGSVFGGGNGDYDYDGNNVYVKGSAHNDANKVATLCGSSTGDANKPTQSSTFVDVNINGGTIANVFGGGNAANVTNAVTHINGAESHGTVARAFAGGNSATAVGSATIAVNGTQGTNLNVRTVFGGNNQAEMGIVPNVALTSGKVDTVYGGGNAGNMTGSDGDGNSTYVEINSSNIQVKEVYGGCNAADVAHNTMVDMKLGTVTGNIYGGNNVSGTVGSSDQGGIAIVNLNGGTVSGNVFGGSNGDYGCTNANGEYTGGLYQGMTLPVSTGTKVVVEGNASITGNIYGGGNMAPVGNSTNNGNAIVELTSGTVTGNAFAGGRMASVNGFATIYTTSSSNITITNVFGGNDIAGSVSNSGDATRPLAISGVAEGTALDGTTVLNASNSASYVRIDGSPTITNVYGGGNGDYTYAVADGKTHVTGTNTDVYLCNATGVSNKPIQSSTFVDIMSDGGTIANAFGGGNAADVTNAVTHINGNADGSHGTIDTAYAGGNSATVTASATIVLNATANESEDNFNVTTIFGGNNQAAMAIVPTVTLTEGRADVVYGGGNAGNMTANVDGKSTYIEVNSDDVYVNEIYGGCNAANVLNNSVVNMQEGHVGTIYGGNNVSGTINGQTLVTLAGGEVTGNVFGGSNGDYGCNDGSVYTSGIYSTPTPKTLPVSNATKVVVDGDCEISGSIYGGGNMAPVGTSASNNGNAVVELTSGNVTGNAFAGGRMADVYGFATIYTTATSSIQINNVYGGNDIAGSVSNSTNTARTSTIGNGATTTLDGTVDLTGANAASYVQILGNPVIGNVFGGGNGDYDYEGTAVYKKGSDHDVAANKVSGLCAQSYSKPVQTSSLVDVKLNPAITADNTLAEGSITNVFGGGNAANVATALTHINGEATHGTITTAYAGGNSATVTSSASLKLNASNGNANGATDNVTTIFGGNNLAAMGIVPTLNLVSGKASEVYGGGNAGNMTCTSDANNRSTYVNIASANVNLGTVYGGCKAADVSKDAVVEMSNGTVGTIYGGNNISGTIATTTKVNLTGGTVTGDVFGGSNGNYGCNNGTIYTEGDAVSTYDTVTIPVTKNTLVLVQGANVAGNVYGGGHMAPVGTPEQGTVGQDGYVAAAGSAVVQLVSGTVTGSAFAGGRMAPVYGSSTVNFPESPVPSSITIGSVFAGNDIANTTAAARTANGVVTVKGHPHITNVFAGGNGDYVYDFDNHTVVAYGETLSICDLQKPNVNSGTVNVQMDDNAAGLIVNVYGGANAADVTAGTTVTMTSGTVTNLYGGNNITGTVGGKATVTLTGGDVTNVFGGGNGDYGCSSSGQYSSGKYAGWALPKVKETEVNVQLGTNVMGSAQAPVNIYGGGNMAPVGDVGLGRTQVNLISGTVHGSAFAGGRMADVRGFATICTPEGSNITIDNVYGGNDIAGAVVVTTGTRQTDDGEGNTVNATAIDGTTVLDYANAASYVKIEGSPTIANVYGGGNGDYEYHEGYVYPSSTTEFTSANAIHDLCGASAPTQSSTFVDMNLSSGGTVDRTFGGGNAANVAVATTHINGAADNNGAANHGTIAQSYAGGNAATVTGSAKLALIAEAGSATANVNTIFGGNNLAEMSIIPNLSLTSGKTHVVYGGGNQGAMTADVTVGDVRHLSTYVEINSEDIVITDAVYGGCRAAAVGKEVTLQDGSVTRLGGTMVKMTDGTVKDIFGGNDVADKAHYAHVEISGGTVNGNVYGGSNGMYDYIGNSIYPFNHTSGDPIATLGATATRAAVDSSDIQILGGTFKGNIYGGGLAGDGTYAHTNIDGEDVVLKGEVFGAGRGNVAAIGTCGDHLGNVQHSQLELKNVDASNSTIATVYGGGHAGDAVNTELILYPTFQKHLTWLYGGAYAANITGTAYTHIAGAADVAAVDTVYGGNNFAGTVQKSDLNIEAGTYNTIFGAGNGAYKYKDLLGEDNLCDTVPYNMQVEMNLGVAIPKSGITDAQRNQLLTQLKVQGNVYGGGNMGVVGKDLNRDGAVRDCAVTDDGNTTTYNEQGSIVTNIYSGVYNSHVFGGARGREAVDPTFGKWKWYGRRQLVFGYKQINMYDGQIEHSLYGGSEFIDDGYPWLYVDNSNALSLDQSDFINTTATKMLPPTGVVNIMGGIVKKNMYGGGYLGNIYGSVYVNVGKKAVDSSYVWSRNYNVAGAPAYYDNFKPVLDAEDIYLMASIYNGSDWGEAYSNAVFDTRGFYGGESQIFVDGRDYNTSASTTGSNLPALDINFSLIGAGTSTEGGDKGSKIIVRHYGASGCNNEGADLSKQLYSIQRAKLVLLDSCFFVLTGEQDAFSAYASPDYTFNRIDTLTFRGTNTIEIEDPAKYIGKIRSEQKIKYFITYDETGGRKHADQYNTSDLVDASNELASHAINCSENSDYCSRVATTGDNKLIIENGTYVSVRPYVSGTVDENVPYGPVLGYMFLMADNNGTESYVYARDKYKHKNTGNQMSDTVNTTDGGFYGTCTSENSFQSNTPEDPLTQQLPYENASRTNNNYRVWKIGKVGGMRSRAISIVAHANVISAPGTGCDNYQIPACTIGTTPNTSTYDKFAVAHATLEMPPSASGNYYQITGMSIDADNGGQITLVQSAFDFTGGTHPTDGTKPQVTIPQGQSGWMDLAGTTQNPISPDRGNELQHIANDPNFTFGLSFRTNTNFGGVFPNHNTNNDTVQGEGYWKRSVLVGDANFAAIDGLMTDEVDLQAANGVIPTIDFNLTYSTEFNTTVIRQVVLTVMEYNSEGQKVGPIDVTLTLATVVDDFKDIDISLLAMYNEGQSNTYKRKIVLPASFKARTIYLTDIEWVPDLRNVPANATRGDAADPTGQYFKLTGKDATKNSIDLFGVSIDVTENVTDNIANTLGWYDIASDYRSFDVFSEATKGMTDPQACALFTASGKRYDTIPATLGPNSPSPGVDTTHHRGSNASVWGDGKEVYIGKLDGRATAAIDATLHFNGNEIYRADDTCGYVKLHFRWSGAADDNGTFAVNIRIKSRIAGDTIYIASQKTSLKRGTKTLLQASPEQFNELDYAKRPNKYVTTIIEAMRKYEDGDVLCVLDTFKINESQNITINGAEYNKLQIIRYSGSHDDAPGKDCAYRGPMFRIEGNGQFAAYDCWFNGSGNTRVKRAPNASPFSGESYPAVDGGAPAIANDNARNRLCDTLWANAPIFSVQEKGRLVLLRNCEVSNNFNGTQLTLRPLTDGPTFWGTSSVIKDRYTYKTTVTGNGNSTTSYNTVDVAHGAGYTVPNGSDLVSGPVPVVYYDASDAFYPGGAIGIYKNTDATPTVILGNNVNIHDNLVIDHATSGTIYNRGAAVYNREGTVQIGNTKNGGDVVTITNNYSLPSSATERARSFVLVDKTVMWPWTETDAESHTINRFGTRSIPVFQLTDGKTVKTFTSRYGEQETMNIPTTANLSNVFLTRTKPGAGVDDKVLNDGLTNLITFNSELGAETRVGITKWFPGTNYVGQTVSHSDDYKLVRDTIKFGQLTNTKYLYAQNNFANGLFFDDSLTSYVFYHKTVSPVLIYFQRCASFKPRQNVDARRTDGYARTRGDVLIDAEDPLGYEMNPDSKCSAMLDTLIYRVQGGFYPYTYTWQCAPVASYTESDGYYYGSSVDWGTADQDNSNVRTVRTTTTPYDNSISNMQIADPQNSNTMIDDVNSRNKRLASSADSCVTVSLVMRPTAASLDYVYRVVGNDLTGNCPVSQEVDVRVVRAEKASAEARYTNAEDAKWLDKSPLAVDNPGMDHNLDARIGKNKAEPNTTGDSTRARYLRLCEGVKLGVDVAPSWNDGYVVMEGHYLQQNDLSLVFNAEDKVVVDNENSARTLSDQFFCPGDELTLSTYKTLKEAVSGDENKATVTSEQTIVVDGLTFEGTGRVDGPCTITIQTGTEVNKTINLTDNKKSVMITSNEGKREVQVWSHKTSSDFMMWDFDPQAPATNVNFVMPEHNYKIKAIYKPSQHWFEVVTSLNPTDPFPVGTDNNGDPISEKPGYSVNYDGNVTITNRAGLAWLISTCNGLNYQQAQEFHNKTVTIAPEAGYDMDMSAYLWTPLGTQNNPFSGNFQGNNVSIKGIICMEDNLTYVGFFGNVGHDNPGSVIGQQATATINQLVLDKATIKGNNYVGGIAAMINNGTQVTNNKIENASMISGSYMVGGVAARVNGAVTIDQNSLSGVDFLGNAVCTGGIVAMDNESPNHIVERTVCGETQRFENGETYSVDGSTPTGTIDGPVIINITATTENGTNVQTIEVGSDEQVTIDTYNRNVTSENDVNDPTGETVTDGVVNTTVSGFSITVCSVIQVGSNFTNNNVWVSTEKMESSNKESGTVAETNQSGTGKGGFFSRFFGAKSAAPQIYIANNYVRFRSSGKSQVSGGLMGAASNSNMVNNYVYGSVASENNAGALVGYVGNNVDIDRCYYQDGTSPNGGFGGGKRVKSNLAITSFSGSGNRVRMASSVYGDVDNLTRALNNWALAQQRYAGGDTILSWRSDLLSENNGLPLFGNPDLIEVRDTTFNSICDSFYYDGAEYFASAVFKVRMIDTVKYIDSTMAFVYDVHYSQVNNVNDSVVSGEGYEGYGFSLTADEIEEMASQFDRHLFRTIELVDSTLSAYGCDSVIVLNLTVYPKVDIDEVDDEPETPAEVAFDVEVYPNPTLGGVTVESVGLESIEVYDAVSRLVIRKNGLEGDSARLDLSGFSTGVYYFRITTQHGVAIKKVIKK